jgi:hypothetical protein
VCNLYICIFRLLRSDFLFKLMGVGGIFIICSSDQKCGLGVESKILPSKSNSARRIGINI